MNKIKEFFVWLVKLIFNPLKAIVTIPVSDRFITFINKHYWIRMLLALVITVIVMFTIYNFRG